MKNDYPIGTVIRVLHSGDEGIIIDREEPLQGHITYYVEMSYGETFRLSPISIAPIDDPLHMQLEEWNSIGRKRGYTELYLFRDRTTGKWVAFFGKADAGATTVREDNPQLDFYWHWKIRKPK